MRHQIKPDYETVIVGAGFSSIGAAIKLDKAGLHDYLMIEAGDGVGGTWHWNTFPASPWTSRRSPISSPSSRAGIGHAPTRRAGN